MEKRSFLIIGAFLVIAFQATAETVYMDASQPTWTWSQTTLTEGSQYRLVVRGTFSVWDLFTWNSFSSHCGAPLWVNGSWTERDAETSFALPDGGNCEPLPTHNGNFQINLGNWDGHLHPEGGLLEEPTIDHTYSYIVEGQGSPIGFMIGDFPHDDNHNGLTIEISEMLECNISAVLPAFPWNTGDTIAIVGTGFSSDVVPLIGGIEAAPYTWISSTRITGTVPSMADGDYSLAISSPGRFECLFSQSVVSTEGQTWGALKSMYR